MWNDWRCSYIEKTRALVWVFFSLKMLHAWVLSCFTLCLTLCDPIDCSPPGSSVQEILRARILEWAAMPSSRGSSQPRDGNHISCVSCIGRWFLYHWGFLCGSAGKESVCNVGDLGSIPGLGRSLGEAKGCPLQYSGLKNSLDCIDHEVAKSWVWLSLHFTSLPLETPGKPWKGSFPIIFTFSSLATSLKCISLVLPVSSA